MKELWAGVVFFGYVDRLFVAGSCYIDLYVEIKRYACRLSMWYFKFEILKVYKIL